MGEEPLASWPVPERMHTVVKAQTKTRAMESCTETQLRKKCLSCTCARTKAVHEQRGTFFVLQIGNVNYSLLRLDTLCEHFNSMPKAKYLVLVECLCAQENLCMAHGSMTSRKEATVHVLLIKSSSPFLHETPKKLRAVLVKTTASEPDPAKRKHRPTNACVPGSVQLLDFSQYSFCANSVPSWIAGIVQRKNCTDDH